MEQTDFDLTAKLSYKPRLLARIKWWFRRYKYIKERAKKGWSSYDVWDFDAYLATVIGGGLEFLAHSHMSHPYYITPKEWAERLQYIANCFKQYNEEPPCPAYDAYRAACLTERKKGCVTIFSNEELVRAWREEEERNHKEKMKRLKEGFDLLYEVYPNLWD